MDGKESITGSKQTEAEDQKVISAEEHSDEQTSETQEEPEEFVREQTDGEAPVQAQEPGDEDAAEDQETLSDKEILPDIDLSEEDPEKLLEAYDETLRDFEEGEIVKGVVVKIDRDEVMVDVGYKSEGYIPLSEFGTMPDGTPKVKVGDPVDVYLLRKEDQDGLVVLSKEIADQKIVWDSIAEAYERGEVVQGKIVRRIKGGLKVEIGNVKAFLPASQVELRPVQNFDRYIGKTLDMKVIKLSKRRRNIVLSRRVILEEEMEAKRKATLSTLEPEQVR